MRIAITNDTRMIVEALRRIIVDSGQHELAWVATSGKEAVAKCAQDVPDVLLMDLEMPDIDGVEATRRIMAASPCPILVVTSTVDSRAAQVFACLGAGALDVLKLPRGMEELRNSHGSLLAKLKTVAQLVQPSPARRAPVVPEKARAQHLVAIGASAGGPSAVSSILRALPEDFPAAIVLVQHIDGEFATPLVEWLSEQSKLPVKLAQNGDSPRRGQVLMAGTGGHLILTESQLLAYSQEPALSAYCPSIDTFFESMARRWRGPMTGVLLTGMGTDGARGLKSLYDAGALTLAQDAATCAVYGMPKAAAQLGAAREILPLAEMAPRLIREAKAPRPSRSGEAASFVPIPLGGAQ